MPNPRWTHDRKLTGSRCGIVGVDEAGRGCLAGPVVAAAVVLPVAFFRDAKNRKRTEEMNDSKQFNENKREQLYSVIMEMVEKRILFGAFGQASIDEIESRNIVGATCLAMHRAMDKVSDQSAGIWNPTSKKNFELFQTQEKKKRIWSVVIDGRPMKKLSYQHDGLIKGDTKSLAIAMASILAKVTRDRYMRELHEQFPFFGFDSNKGYGAPVHLNALKNYGPTEHHRPRFLRNIALGNSESSVPSNGEQSQLSFL